VRAYVLLLLLLGAAVVSQNVEGSVQRYCVKNFGENVCTEAQLNNNPSTGHWRTSQSAALTNFETRRQIDNWCSGPSISYPAFRTTSGQNASSLHLAGTSYSQVNNGGTPPGCPPSSEQHVIAVSACPSWAAPCEEPPPPPECDADDNPSIYYIHEVGALGDTFGCEAGCRVDYTRMLVVRIGSTNSGPVRVEEYRPGVACVGDDAEPLVTLNENASCVSLGGVTACAGGNSRGELMGVGGDYTLPNSVTVDGAEFYVPDDADAEICTPLQNGGVVCPSSLTVYDSGDAVIEPSVTIAAKGGKAPSNASSEGSEGERTVNYYNSSKVSNFASSGETPGENTGVAVEPSSTPGDGDLPGAEGGLGNLGPDIAAALAYAHEETCPADFPDCDNIDLSGTWTIFNLPSVGGSSVDCPRPVLVYYETELTLDMFCDFFDGEVMQPFLFWFFGLVWSFAAVRIVLSA